jgi:glycosyltransferase involved in cell wall biosynthesis
VLDEIIEAGYHKILFVDDGSRDNTISEIKAAQARHSQAMIVLVSHMINRRHGAGNKTAIEFFRRYGDQLGVKYVVFFDADGQMDIKDMSTFEAAIKRNPNIDVIQ